MKSADKNLATKLKAKLASFARRTPLPGIGEAAARDAFVMQLVESIHRVRYVGIIKSRPISSSRADPTSETYDPVKAALLALRNGDLEEASWQVFLFVHFGKNLRTGYRLTRDIYGGLGTKTWDWKTVSKSPKKFRQWLSSHESQLRGADGVKRTFGNHRKYESLSGTSAGGTGAAVESYVDWVKRAGSHSKLFQDAIKEGKSPAGAFGVLFKSMRAVSRFGRTARFDYLSMIGKMGIAKIIPDSTHLAGATGPLTGARLLLTGNAGDKMASRQVEGTVNSLADALGVDKQVMEDALCNWQKSPRKFKAFRG